MQIFYPAPLQAGSRIAVTAFSAGVAPAQHPRLDYVLNDFRQLGFEIIEGQCLRENVRHVSAPKAQRAAELEAFLCDNSVHAVAPPWGGEFALELLPLLDFERIGRATPKWLFGYSDVSALACVLYSRCGWATVHCANLMDLIARQDDPLSRQTLSHLGRSVGDSFCQESSEKYQIRYIRFEDQVDACFQLTETTAWQRLGAQGPVQLQGRLIGGCLDILQHILETDYFPLTALTQQHAPAGTLLYLENAEMSLLDLKRSLLSLRYRGVFAGITGLLMGRNTGPEDAELTYAEVLQDVLGDLPCEALYDVDIGHRPPHLTLINGALAEVRYAAHRGQLVQTLYA